MCHPPGKLANLTDQGKSTLGKLKHVPLIFAVLVLFFLGTNLAWLVLDHSAPTWDDATYLRNSLLMYDTLSEGGLLRYAAKFLTVMDDKPPLIAALPTPVYLLVGRHSRAAAAVNLGFMLLLFPAVFR